MAALLPSAAAAAPDAVNVKLRDTRWRVLTLDGAPVAEQTPGAAEPHIVWSSQSQQLSGYAGCNRLRGRYVQRGTQLAVTTAPATSRMACPAEQMQFEQTLLQALAATDAYRVEGHVLSLMQGETVRVTLTDTRAAKAAVKSR